MTTDFKRLDAILSATAQTLRERVQQEIADCSIHTPPPKNITDAQRTGTFLGRLPNINTIDVCRILLDVKNFLREANHLYLKKSEYRLRIVKRGRKPVKGVKYSYGGSIPLEYAQCFDMYVALERK